MEEQNTNLKKDKESFVLIGTKTFYYGLGGGYFEYNKFIENKGGQFSLEIIERINDMKSIERLVIKMKRKDDIDNAIQEL